VRARHHTLAREVTLRHAVELEDCSVMLRQQRKPVLPRHPDKNVREGFGFQII